MSIEAMRPSTGLGVVIDPDAEAAARDAGASEDELALIRNLKGRVADFQAARASLQALGAQVAKSNDYDTLIEYGELVNRADSIQSKIESVTQAIDKAMAWARATFGRQGMQDLSDLGIAWFIPVAAIGAALALIGYFLNDYAKFVARFREQQRIAGELVAAGADPASAQQQAARAVASTSPGWLAQLTGNGMNLTSMLAIGGLAFLAWLGWKRYRGA